MKKLILLNLDDYVAIYYDDELIHYGNSYEYDTLEGGLELCEEYGIPGKDFIFETKDFEDLTEECCDEIWGSGSPLTSFSDLEWVDGI